MSENSWLEKLKMMDKIHPDLLQGPGDDAAVLRAGSGEFGLVSTDMLIDRVHFDSLLHAPELVGRKALAVNLSDIAAMGGRPGYFTVSLAVPWGTSEEYLERIYLGMLPLMEEFHVALAGGDTTSTPGPLVVNVTIFGESIGGRFALRSHAGEDDAILVTGNLGGSLLTGRHLSFQPRVREAAFLLERYPVRGMMDLSDGLAQDLRRMCSACGLGAVIYPDSVPVDKSIKGQPDSLQKACTDGEDFELLMTIPEEGASELLSSQPLAPVTISKIGNICKEKGLRLMRPSGPEPLSWTGYEHRF